MSEQISRPDSSRTGDELDDDGDDHGGLSASQGLPPQQQEQQTLSEAGPRSDSIATTASTTTSSRSSISTSSGPEVPPSSPPPPLMGNPRTARPLPTFGIAAVEGSGAYRSGGIPTAAAAAAADQYDDDDNDFGGGGKRRERGSSASSSVVGLAAAAAAAAAAASGGAATAGTAGGRIRGSDAGSFSFPFSAGNGIESLSSSPRTRRTSRLGSIGLGVFTPLATPIGGGGQLDVGDGDDDEEQAGLTGNANANAYGWTSTFPPRRASVVSQARSSSVSSTSSSSVSLTNTTARRRDGRRDRRSGASGTEESIGEEEEEEERLEDEERTGEAVAAGMEDGRSPTLDGIGSSAADTRRNRSPAGFAHAQGEESYLPPPSPLHHHHPSGESAGSAGATPPIEQTPRLGGGGGGGGGDGPWQRSPKLHQGGVGGESPTLGREVAASSAAAAARGWSPQQQRYGSLSLLFCPPSPPSPDESLSMVKCAIEQKLTRVQTPLRRQLLSTSLDRDGRDGRETPVCVQPRRLPTRRRIGHLPSRDPSESKSLGSVADAESAVVFVVAGCSGLADFGDPEPDGGVGVPVATAIAAAWREAVSSYRRAGARSGGCSSERCDGTIAPTRADPRRLAFVATFTRRLESLVLFARGESRSGHDHDSSRAYVRRLIAIGGDVFAYVVAVFIACFERVELAPAAADGTEGDEVAGDRFAREPDLG